MRKKNKQYFYEQVSGQVDKFYVSTELHWDISDIWFLGGKFSSWNVFFQHFFMIYFKTLKYFNVALLIFLYAVQNTTKCKPFPSAFFIIFVASKIIALYTYIYVKVLLIACQCLPVYGTI